jgi:NAD(P)-dependent dehydrogenase (short-subunit alcohol dehydrogenase family)
VPVAVVIGNSDGIGLALTELLLSEGWEVAGVSRSGSRLAAQRYEHHILDVCEVGYSQHLASVVSQLPGLDVCVYCAGIGELLEVETLATERRVFEVNLVGAVATAQVVVPVMVRAGHGHWIGLSSQADVLIHGRAPSYAASKAGLSSYLEGLALACRPRGVAITNVRFGFVDTKLAKSPRRPFMISAAQAALHLRRCMETRPVRYTFPKRTAALLWFVQLAQLVRRVFQ